MSVLGVLGLGLGFRGLGFRVSGCCSGFSGFRSRHLCKLRTKLGLTKRLCLPEGDRDRMPEEWEATTREAFFESLEASGFDAAKVRHFDVVLGWTG